MRWGGEFSARSYSARVFKGDGPQARIYPRLGDRIAIQDYITNGHHQEEEDQPRVKFDVNERAPARIKVIGVGDGGCNCVKCMMRHSVPGVTFAMVNTDIKALETDDPAVKPNR